MRQSLRAGLREGGAGGVLVEAADAAHVVPEGAGEVLFCFGARGRELGGWGLGGDGGDDVAHALDVVADAEGGGAAV